MLEIIFILLIFILFISIAANVVLFFKLRNNNAKDTTIFKEILDKVTSNELNYIDSSAINIIEVLKKHYQIDYCTILIKEDSKLKIIASDVNDIYKKNIEEHCLSLLINNKGRAIIQSSDEMFLDYKSASDRGIKYSYFLPLEDIGCIFIENHEEYLRNNFEVEFFKVVVKNIGIILQNCIYQDKISTLAMRDNLTSLYNRNYMQKHIELLKKNCKSLSIAIMDIDHFKSCNDTYGHDFGDLVLKTASNFIRDNLDKSDQIYRWGGEEFIMTFANQDVNAAKFKLDNIREALSQQDISDGKTTIKITASFGIAQFSNDLTLDEVMKKIDNALYYSKEHGRNQVNIAI